MYKIMAIIILLGFTFTGCSNPIHSLTPSSPEPKKSIKKPYQKRTPAKQKAYSKTMHRVASSIKDDPNYNRIALDTAQKKAWFRDLTYRLWDRQISKYQFVSEGLSQYPAHEYEFNFVVRGFNS